MNIAITGAKGMLAHALIKKLFEHKLILLDLPEVDITQAASVAKALANADFVFHCAAYTNVDGAETDYKKAFAVNEQGTEYIARVCAQKDIPLVYISTDYVFGGTNRSTPWTEEEIPSPQGRYAQSKYAGEKKVQEICQKYFIVRTAWIYGEQGKNFVDTMLKLAKEKKSLKVVNDQYGSPTSTEDLAAALVEFLCITDYGIYHLTNQGITTWYAFSKKIFELANIAVDIEPCTTAEFPRPAPRPAYSVLKNEHWEKIGKPLLPSWEKGLEKYLKKILVKEHG